MGVPFIAVMPTSPSASKVTLVESQRGRCHFVQSSSGLYGEAERVTKKTSGHLLPRYADTYFCDEWLNTQELDTSALATALTEFERSGHWD